MSYVIVAIIVSLVFVLTTTVFSRENIQKIMYVDSDPKEFDRTAKEETRDLKIPQMHLRAAW